MVPGVQAYLKMVKEEKINVEEVVKKVNVETKVKEEMTKIGAMVKHGVVAQDVITLMEAGEFPQLMKMEAQAHLLDVVEEFGFRAFINEVIVDQAVQRKEQSVGVKAFMKMVQKANVNVEQVFGETITKEFGSQDAQPVQELAKVSMMMKEGVQAQEIISMVDAGQLPALKLPETQMALLNIVEREGHSALACQVLIEDSVQSIIQGDVWY